MSNDKLRDTLMRDAVEAIEALLPDVKDDNHGGYDARDVRFWRSTAARLREAIAASKPEPQAQAAEHEVWRFGFVGAAFVFMKDGPYVLLEQIKKHHREDIAKRDAALDACAEALKYAQFYSNKQHVIEKMNAAITKAQEARKS